MDKVKFGASFLLLIPALALGRGVSPYLPLSIEPEMESQVERVLILGDQPVMRRPIAAATVLDALPKACKVDAELCENVRRYLARFTRDSGISYATLEAAGTSGRGDEAVRPNSYGEAESSHWSGAAQVYLQPSDYVLLDIGGVGYQSRGTFSGSMVSLGFDWAQLDLGERPHWFSPMSDSSMLMSTEAATMPGITLSNYRPLTRARFHYELFIARMSESDHIKFRDGYTHGHPRLNGLHLDIEPTPGWSIGVNRLMQYGGGARGGGSVSDLFKAFFNPSGNQRNPADQQVFGNQEASFTSSLLFPGRVPFSVYFEYGGEDTSRGKNYLLGKSALSVGIHFPRLWQRWDLTVEASEWQNSWYSHFIYQDGLTNFGRVTGNWGADQRVFNNDVGARSQTLILRYQPRFGGLFEFDYRQLQNQLYGPYAYDRYHDVLLRYSHPWQGLMVGAEVERGNDVFSQSFTRVGAFVRYDGGVGGMASALSGTTGVTDGGEIITNGELFVEAGANVSRQNIDVSVATNRYNGPIKSGYHLSVGARRAASEHSDFGARIEADDIQGANLLGVRLLDYRYRFSFPLALTVGIGAARYNLATPAYGIYYGGGAQWRNLFPGWDLGFEVRYANSVARTKVLPSDPPIIGGRTDAFYNILSATLGVSRHF